MAEYQKVCEWCKKEFVAKDPRALSCSTRCKSAKKYAKCRNERAPPAVYQKVCKWCKQGFETKTKRAQCCTEKCRDAQKYQANKEPIKARSRQRGAENREEIKYKKYEHYDAVGCLAVTQRGRQRLADIMRDPVRLEKYRSYHRDWYRKSSARKKQEAERAAYLADPINAARVAAANYERMTPEEREKWHEKREEEQERAERKAKRDALKKTIRATEDIEQDPTWKDLEWSCPVLEKKKKS